MKRLLLTISILTANILLLYSADLINIYGANSIADGSGYATLKAAFDAINASPSQSAKNIEIRINAPVTETATASLSAMNWNSLTIFPTADNITIDADMGSAVIRLNGANNVIIDGRVNKTGAAASLTIQNNSAAGGAVAVDFVNSAQYNILQYCKIKAQLADNSRGVVFIGSSSSGDGNSFNTIQHNEISGIDADKRPSHAIASNGTAGRENKNNQIINNKVFDFINKAANSNGLTLISGSQNFSISGNSFYETVTDFAPEGGYNYYAIRTNTNSAHNITNNYIGGNAAESAGLWKTIKGNESAHHSFTAIYVAGKADEASLVQGNTIKNFNIVTGGSATNHDTWDGIFIEGGNVDVLNNTIGAATGTASIYIEATHGNTIATSHAILNNSTGTVNIKNNIIGSIKIEGAPGYSHSFEGIYLRAQANITYIADNLIGSVSEANSINVSGTANASTYKQDAYGIYSASQNEVHITRNTIANVRNAYSGTLTAARTRAIRVVAGSNYIENNTIFDISSSSNQAAGINSSASVIGIDNSANTAGTIQKIAGNTIYNLKADNGGASAAACFGIYFFGPTNAQRNIIEDNFIHSISSSNSSNNTIIIGMLLHRGNNTVSNNIISLGLNLTTGYRIFGIWDDSGSSNHNNLYFNTIYIGGDVTPGTETSVSTALWNQNNTSTRDYRNNIFANQRLLNGAGSDNLYSVRIGGRTGLTMDYNNYFSVGGRLGQSGSRPLRPNLASWRPETRGDDNSFEVDPLFVNTSLAYTSAQDFITNISIGNLPGTVIAGIADDYDGVERLDPPKIGAFENNNFLWYGTVSTDFNNPDNWTNGGGDGIVPPNGADVTFADNPVNSCFLDKERTIRNIIINSGNANNYFVLNGMTLNLKGELSFTNNAKLDAKATGSVLVLKGTAEQSLALGSVLDNEFAGLSLDNELGFVQNTDYLITESFTLTNGAYSIGNNTLTINGSLAQAAGTLTGGVASNITFGGTSLATILPQVELNNLTINRANGINMAGNVSVGGTLALTDGTLVLGANQLTISGNSPTGTGSVNASDASAELVLSNPLAITLLPTFFGGNAVNNLTISGTGGTSSRGDFTVNGILHLQAANASAIKGSLDMFNSGDATDERKTLTMGASATTIGIGDVTGKVKRTSIGANTAYTFGSQFSTITFTGGTGDQLPTDLTFIIKIGTVPPNAIKNDAVQRYYEIIRTGGSDPTRFNLNLRYLDSELNANEQSKMVFWDHHVPYNGLSPHQHGVSVHNTTNNYMSLASHGIGYLVENEYDGEVAWEEGLTPDQSKLWLFADRATASGPDIFVWIGPGHVGNENNWDYNGNWADNCSPKNAAEGNCGEAQDYQNHRVFIQEAPYKPTENVPADLVVRSLYIEQGGEFNAPSSITVHGALDDDNGFVSWNNQGTFNAGTNTVTFKSDNAVIAGDTDFYDLGIDNEAKLSMIAGTRIGIENDFTLTGTGKLNTTFYGSSTVEYNGAAQTVINPENNEYSTLILSGNGAKTLPAELSKILGDFSINETASTSGTTGLTIGGSMNIESGASFATGAFNHLLKGNFENYGTFTSAAANVFTFNGTSNQLITGDSRSDFGIMELNNSNGLTMFANVDINNELRLTSGTIALASNTLGINGIITGAGPTEKISTTSLSSLSFGGTGAFTVPDNLFVNSPTINNLTVNRNGGVSLGNQDFTVLGNIDLTVGNLVVGSTTLGIDGTTSGTAKIELSKSSSLSFGGTEQFTISDDFFAGTTEISNLTINRTNGVVIGNQIFTINGVLDLERGELNATGKTLNIAGNIYANNGTLATNSSTTLCFSENLETDPAIFLPGSLFSDNTVGTLLINRTNGFNAGNQDIIISDKLILEKGKINGNNNLFIFNHGSAFSTSASETAPSDENRYINGCVRKIGNTAFTFPIGEVNVYAPIAISEAEGGGAAGDFFDACYNYYNPSLDLYNTNSLGTGVHHVSSSEYWTLERTGTNNVKVTLSWDARSNGVTNLVDLIVAHWDGAKWENKGNTATTGTIDAGTITSLLITGFSPFTLASTSAENPLPIELLRFNAECASGGIRMDWATASETNNDFFTIERSSDAISFKPIAIIEGAGNSSMELKYETTDNAGELSNYPVWYYRIRQTDYDGSYGYSKTIAASCYLKSINDIWVYPNPVSNEIEIELKESSGPVSYEIISSAGYSVFNGSFVQKTSIPASQIAPGVYFVKFKYGDNSSFVKLIKE
jgi:hypothetical protein